MAEITFCPRCGRIGEFDDYRSGPYCPTCIIPADAKDGPTIRGHWCDGLREFQEGIYSGTPRLDHYGTVISIGDEYADEVNPTPILFCPMCGVKL